MPILEDGQLFERYRINRWLGSGIAGESYEAEDRILQRKVTLKLIHPRATLPDSARRQFFREMQGISLLNHSYLATVLDYGELDGRIYVVRRYVSSGSLLGTNGRLWFHPPLPATDAFKYAHQLAQALQYIHQHGYLHGSLTFGNVLVLRGPNIEDDTNYAPFLMADVGLSNFVRRFGNPGIGTPPVSAAPEQLGKLVTPASDQFALAVLLYFWLTGRPPYLGTPDEVEHLKLSETITPLSMLNPGISLEQDSIILRALAASPEERHATILAFSEALMDSLNSPVQHFALAASAEVEPQETLSEYLHTSPDGSSSTLPSERAKTGTEEPLPEVTKTSLEAPPLEEVAPASATPIEAESYRSPLDGLPPLPQTEPGSASPLSEIDSVAFSEAKADYLPAIPETPQLEEGAFPIEIEFVLSSPAELAAPQIAQPASPPDAELATEPPTPAHELAVETRAEPGASAEVTPLDKQPVTGEETPPAPCVPPEEPPAPVDGDSLASLSTEPQAITDGAGNVVHPDEQPAKIEEVAPEISQIEDEITPADDQISSNASSATEAEVSPVVPVEELAIINTEEAEEPAPTALLSEQVEPNAEGNDDAAPTVPLEELYATPEETTSAVAPAPAERVSADPITPNAPLSTTERAEADLAQPPDKPSLANDAEPQSSSEPAGEQALDEAANPPVPAAEEDSTNDSGASSHPLESAGTTSETYQPGEATMASPRLIISSPYTGGSYEFLLANGETNIGRAGASDLVLEQDDLTSRHHALLKRTGEHVLIFDKHSHNGVFINGQKIEAGRGYELADGDHLGIGNYELIFRSASGSQVSQLI